MLLSLGARRVSFPDGSEFEGVGIKPDVEVDMTVQDLRTGNDPVLDKANTLIRELEDRKQ
jgi:carboxyl-terminal processing protease